MGMPEFLCKLWYDAHEHTYGKSRSAGAGVNIDYQRKSGDASTFFGNTLITMIVLACVCNMSSVVLAVFAGDDSLLWFLEDLRNIFDMLSKLFNLEAKVMYYENAYFCSKFLLYDDDRYYFVPDPLKLVSKLGRRYRIVTGSRESILRR